MTGKRTVLHGTPQHSMEEFIKVHDYPPSCHSDEAPKWGTIWSNTPTEWKVALYQRAQESSVVKITRRGFRCECVLLSTPAGLSLQTGQSEQMLSGAPGTRRILVRQGWGAELLLHGILFLTKAGCDNKVHSERDWGWGSDLCSASFQRFCVNWCFQWLMWIFTPSALFLKFPSLLLQNLVSWYNFNIKAIWGMLEAGVIAFSPVIGSWLTLTWLSSLILVRVLLE